MFDQVGNQNVSFHMMRLKYKLGVMINVASKNIGVDLTSAMCYVPLLLAFVKTLFVSGWWKRTDKNQIWLLNFIGQIS